MFSVIFEVNPKPSEFELYLALAKDLKPILEGIEGFIDNERFESKSRPGWILSHSTWRDEKSVVRWRTVAKHHETQQRGRDEVFNDYHLRVGEIVSDSTPPEGLKLVEQRLDETEIGDAKFAALTEISPGGDPVPEDLADILTLDRYRPGLLDHDIFASIYNVGKLALLTSWRDRGSAEAFNISSLASIGSVRHRIVRVVRDYGMFDRRESPQYYADVTRA
ncbi:antibiotic biosynthesis monooxygenase [Rhizobium sp. SG570]|uniref:antibiotic biosynthesis monooxygenase family protein n=1 Tax=Rhizobium sp. SG570 TaxID=2587113 RepID=UPI0014486C83|nr:antibiotic biosynthesis monooxygenase [Rhizobium sp. SG570]NKJ39543.1 heme-degrading monooxygenase HmoA [Rhizobium sp. SG570]